MLSVTDGIAFGITLTQLNAERSASGFPLITAEISHLPPSTCEFVHLEIDGCQVTPETADLTELQRFLSVVHNTYDVVVHMPRTVK